MLERCENFFFRSHTLVGDGVLEDLDALALGLDVAALVGALLRVAIDLLQQGAWRGGILLEGVDEDDSHSPPLPKVTFSEDQPALVCREAHTHTQ